MYILEGSCAAYRGHKDIVNDMIQRGVNNYDQIAWCAAYGGHKDIVNDMIQRGSEKAAEGGHERRGAS